MSYTILIFMVAAIGCAIFILNRIRIKILVMGTVEDEIREENIRDLFKVTKFYRWTAYTFILMLIGFFILIILDIILFSFNTISLISLGFNSFLGILIRFIFKRIDKYERMLREALE